MLPLQANGDETLFFTVLVRYDALLTTESDVEFDFTCRIAQSGGNVTWNLTPLISNKEYVVTSWPWLRANFMIIQRSCRQRVHVFVDGHSD